MAEAKRLRVMIADDEMHARILLKAVLTSMKCEVVGEAAVGSEVMGKYRELKPHLLLLDVNMPVKTGDEILEELVKEFPNPFVIMLTSVADMTTIEKCIALGASNYIRKDTPIEEIKVLIKESWQMFTQLRAARAAVAKPPTAAQPH